MDFYSWGCQISAVKCTIKHCNILMLRKNNIYDSRFVQESFVANITICAVYSIFTQAQNGALQKYKYYRKHFDNKMKDGIRDVDK